MALAAVQLADDLYPFGLIYEVSLLADGTELPVANGYVRPIICTGVPWAALWAKSGGTVTITFATPHGIPVLPASTYEVDIQASDDLTAVPLGQYVCTVASSVTITFAVAAGGGAGGTATDNVTIAPPAFWEDDSDSNHANFKQALQINFPAASGANWRYNELRLHEGGSSGEYLFTFPAAADDTVVDGDTLVIAEGTLKFTDMTPTLT